MTDDNDNTDTFTVGAELFNDVVGIGDRDVHRAIEYRDRFAVVEEEVEELSEAVGLMIMRGDYEKGLGLEQAKDAEGHAIEEMADVLVTVFSMAEALDIDIEEAYKRKMEYNMQKTGDKDSNGKVTDDADIDKPDFTDIHDE